MPTEIITAILSAFTAISVCLINGYFEKKKNKTKEQERIQAILNQMADEEQERQAGYMQQIDEVKHAIDKINMKLENVEERIKERVDSLARHVEKHNNFAERMPLVEEKIKVANKRIEDLEDEVKDLRHAN